MLRFPFKSVNHATRGILLILMGISDPGLAESTDLAVGIDQIPVCMNFSCKRKDIVSLSPEEWKEVSNWLATPAPDATTERENIKKAIGWLEVLVGKHTPTHRDRGGDLGDPEARFPGQLDCIDESINTTTYLQLLEDNNLLKHHRVVERAYRRAIFDQHWAGQIEVRDSGERWVVDSWFQHNGYLPYLQSSEAWLDIPLFTSYLDNSQPRPEKEGSFLSRLFD